jgi:hypothetical protein
MVAGKTNSARGRFTAIRGGASGDLAFHKMIIADTVAMLNHQLSAIRRWEDVAWAEFELFEAELGEKYPNGFPDQYHPLTDQAFIRHHTGLALYGSMAVAISAKVEDMLAYLLSAHGLVVLRKGKPHQAAKNAHFRDFLFTLEHACSCSRENISHHGDILFFRELANRFKHSGGKATATFVSEYGRRAEVQTEDDDIPFDRYDWKEMIEQTGEFLSDFARQLDARVPGKSGTE